MDCPSSTNLVIKNMFQILPDSLTG
jgi:hypothetical protein